MDISIIVPVYNSAKYLDKCLKSILRALDNFAGRGEILLVDNNSPDKSYLIMKKYQKEHPEIIFLDKQMTPGAAATRNYGTKKARGKYIWFVDADDTITEDSISELTAIGEDLDVRVW